LANGLVVAGVALLLIGLFVFATSVNSGNSFAGISSIFLLYAGSGLIGISILGNLLVRAAKVVVEGLGGNLNTEGKGYTFNAEEELKAQTQQLMQKQAESKNL
jgi:hypothetical protein